MQLLCPTKGLNVPAGHNAQLEARLSKKLPISHDREDEGTAAIQEAALVAPELGLYEPAGHNVQLALLGEPAA